MGCVSPRVALLERVGEDGKAMPIREALAEALRGGSVTTQDLGGNASTMEFAEAVSNRHG